MGSQCMRITRLSAFIKTALRFSSHRVKMHAFPTRVCKTTSAFTVVWRYKMRVCIGYTRVSASVKTAIAFSSLWRQSTCVSHASLYLLRQLSRFSWYGVQKHACLHLLRRVRLLCLSSYRVLRFPWYGVKVYEFQTRLCIGSDRVSGSAFFGNASQCMRFKCVSTSVKTAFAFLRIALQCRRFTRVSASVKTTSAFSMVWRYNAHISYACLPRLKRLLRFPWYGVTCVSHASLHLLRSVRLLCLSSYCVLRFPWYGVKEYVFHTRICIG